MFRKESISSADPTERDTTSAGLLLDPPFGTSEHLGYFGRQIKLRNISRLLHGVSPCVGVARGA
jgi:hypothetical protein